VLSDLAAVNALGEQVPFNCPNCGGVLWQIQHAKSPRYRCHTGHSFTSKVLLAEQTSKIEETLWIALRMFEERRNLLRNMSDPKSRGYSPSAPERAAEAAVHIGRIREMLKSSEVETPEVAPRRRARAVKRQKSLA
jgi:two-component system chemotaxis response regulator CheB